MRDSVCWPLKRLVQPRRDSPGVSLALASVSLTTDEALASTDAGKGDSSRRFEFDSLSVFRQ